MNEESHHLIAEKRSLIKMGGSVGITLPKEWLDRHNLKPGDEVGVFADGTIKLVTAKELV